MKFTYIYLNHYRSRNGSDYLYIGSHTWSGPAGQLDPTYHGSSRVAAHYRWTPYKTELLEVVSKERKFIAEREWIENYALLYGIADCASVFSPKNSFHLRFKKHGLMLNLHSNTAENALKANTPDVRKKSLDTRRASGALLRFNEAGLTAAHTPEVRSIALQTQLSNGSFHKFQEAARSKEAISRRMKTRTANGAHVKWQKSGQVASSKPEVRQRVAEKLKSSGAFERLNAIATSKDVMSKKAFTKSLNDSYNKGVQTKKERGTLTSKPRNVTVILNGDILYTGPVYGACKFLDHPGWNCAISAKLRSGLTEVRHHGYLFKLVTE